MVVIEKKAPRIFPTSSFSTCLLTSERKAGIPMIAETTKARPIIKKAGEMGEKTMIIKPIFDELIAMRSTLRAPNRSIRRGAAAWVKKPPAPIPIATITATVCVHLYAAMTNATEIERTDKPMMLMKTATAKYDRYGLSVIWDKIAYGVASRQEVLRFGS
mmetsp:Transcript_8305/g.11620  ORF Transcript_8305/g.11620 Transcript_8305/m.11620 type:complete len:160 (-) Transcript_8305:43-522(-)